MSRFHWVWAIVLAAGCATAHPPPKPAALPAPGTEELWAVYAEAVRTSQYPVQDHVFRELTPILRTNPELRWDSQGRVLMVTWTKRKYYEGKAGQPYTLPDTVTVWLTAVPYLRSACRGWGLPPERLPLRIAQSIGTPPPPAEVSLDGGPVDREGCPWTADQLSGAFVRVSEDHLRWMCDNWKSTFTGDPKTSYPWTALGYTFDWGDLLHPVGQSEYVAPPKTTVWIESISTAEEYCGKETP